MAASRLVAKTSSKQIADEDLKGGSPLIYFSAVGTRVLSVDELATQVIAASEEPPGFFVGISSVAKRLRHARRPWR